MSFRRFLIISAIAALPLAAPSVSLASDYPAPPAPQIKALTAPPNEIGISDARDGSLLFKTDRPGRFIKAPNVKTQADINIAGPAIRTKLTQIFQNNSDEWVEGIYVFPLPENAAVDRLRIVIGGRFIEGQIKEKQAAKKIYETAKREGRKASLVEQERPNIFTASVANIGPQESISIQIEYQDTADIKHGTASMVFPMTVAPRFSPAAQILQLASHPGSSNGNGRTNRNGSATAILDPVLDRRRIAPPLTAPQNEPQDYIRLPVSINITLDAGFELADINSPYHAINVDTVDEDTANIRLAEGAVPADRDFKLTWNAAFNSTPQKSVFKEVIGDDTYLMTLVTPPKPTFIEPLSTHQREMIFVIDTSGSMGGTSIIQAREALKLGLSKLKPADRFNIIRFSSAHSSLYNAPRPANPDNIKSALRWVDRLKAGGGTNMMPAMQSALKDSSPNYISESPSESSSGGILKQIVFITDGSIGNETQLFALIQDELKDARLFPVGIGSAPNRYFMSRAAGFGRGTAVTIGNILEVQSQMGDLFAALENPVLTNLQLSLNGQDKDANPNKPENHPEIYPAKLPDLYDGEPVISVIKLASADLPKSISIMGDDPKGIWAETVDLDTAQAAKGLSVIWARRKIAELEDRRYDRALVAEIDKAVLDTALEHHIVTRLTSLVAVDVTPLSRKSGRNISQNLHSQTVPTMLPKGWDFAALSSMVPSAPAPLTQKPNQSAPQSGPSYSKQDGLTLPRTASPHIVLWLIGLIMLALPQFFKTCRRRQAVSQ